VTEIQQNRWDQLIRRAANVVGGGSQVNDTLNELFPTLDVENLNAELAILSGWRLAFGSSSLGGLAANFNIFQLFNPAASGMLVVVERVDMRVSSTQTIEYALSTTALADFTSNRAYRDTRTGITDIPVAQPRDAQTPGNLPTFGQLALTNAVTFTFTDAKGLFVLAPGTGISFGTTVANIGMSCNWLWRERVAEPAELNF